ncbi:MAG: DUF1761 domain-containing protein [Alphaproteobacteria bacterium]|nr:DUF1761 domain-containing protein [Alphaproteobacteria bacterium]
MSGMVVLAVLLAGIAGTFSDWLFMGVLFHDRYMRYPEVWRDGIVGGQDRTAVVYSAALGFVSAAAVVALCVLADATTLSPALEVAFFAWLAGPLVLMITNGFFMKLDWAIVGAHCAGYLVRFLIAGIAAAIFL